MSDARRHLHFKSLRRAQDLAGPTSTKLLHI